MDTKYGNHGRPFGTRAAVMLGLFAGTATGAGFLLAGIPNLELMSLIVALAGSVLGFRNGAICGALAAGIYSLGSPYGIPAVWLLGAQISGLAGIGALGGVWGELVLERMEGPGRLGGILLAALLAFVGTTWYEMVTTLAVLWGFGLDMRVVLLGAVPFYLMHTGSNILLFAVFYPTMAQRLRHVGSNALRGRVKGAAVLCLCCFVWAESPVLAQDPPLSADPDSLPALEATVVTSVPDTTRHGWKRDLWHPFSQSLVEFLGWHGDFVPVQDGGLGAPVMVLGEFSTSSQPLVLRDGLPLGTGHVLADDLGLMPVAGMRIIKSGFGLDAWGGSGGQLDLQRLDPVPSDGFSSYQGTTGPHETYMRNVQLLSPRAPWRFGFEFQENLDVEGYNYTDLPGEEFDPILDGYFPGHAKLRQSHARLTRDLGRGNRLDIDYDFGRKTKDKLPALAADHQEIWADGISVDMHAGWDNLALRTAIFWRNRDVQLSSASAGADSMVRYLGTGREGILFELSLRHRLPEQEFSSPIVSDSLSVEIADTTAQDTTQLAQSVEVDSLRQVVPDSLPPDPFFEVTKTKLRVSLENWVLDDSGADTSWAGPQAGSMHLDGQLARATLESEMDLAGLRGSFKAGGLWTERLGWDPTATAELSGSLSRLKGSLFWEVGGRAPRSDELGTILRHDVAGRILIIDPNADLEREQTRRWGGSVAFDAFGMELAVDGAVGKVEDGITWLADLDHANRGQWVNGANLDYQRLTAAVERQGRFLGWGRIRYEGTWQDYTQNALPASFLPPEQYSRLQLMWENHLFEEDGVVEIAFFSTRVGTMMDPWDVTQSFVLPAHTVQDLIVGFRLVGVDLSLAFRNLTNKKFQTSAGALSQGSRTVMRLAWKFRR